jgi:4-hydroxy-tetrahydrodipicolinate synthase
MLRTRVAPSKFIESPRIMKLARCLVAITTPFTPDDRVDVPALQAHARWLVDAGVSGIVVAGTTGESATLRDPEKLEACNAVWDAVGDRATVIAGVGNNCTRESLEFLSEANSGVRAHAIMSVVPYYNKPNQRGMIAHFRAIADASRLPVVLYNVPGRTVVKMDVETMLELAEHPNVVGIKEASADLHVGAKLLANLPDRVALLSGDDATAFPLMCMGAAGVISVVGNVAPRLMASVADAAADGTPGAAHSELGRLASLHDLMFRYASPLPAKALVSHLGFGASTVRLPLDQLTEEEHSGVLDAGTRLGVAR